MDGGGGNDSEQDDGKWQFHRQETVFPYHLITTEVLPGDQIKETHLAFICCALPSFGTESMLHLLVNQNL